MRLAKYVVLVGLVALFGCKGCGGGGSDNPIRDQVVVESCDNAEDDNGDGWVDCQDPVCQLEDACVFEPPDPAELAPPDDPTSLTDFSESIRFLWEGDNPVVRGLDPDALDMDRVAVVRGQVTDREGNPVSGVRANIAGRREFGYTFSRDDGRLDLVVNGGESVHLRVDGENLLAVDREVTPGKLEYDWASDIVLTPIDENANSINLQEERQFARGSTSNDEDGERTARLYVPPETRATVRLPDGQEATLEKNATIRLTEYTVGDTGDEAMPAGLPEESAYTYALELSVDEARDVNADEVRFNQPVYLYVDNFLEFPVGTPVPSGFYLRSSTVWEPNPNGIVMQRTADGVSVVESGANADGGVRQFLDLSSEELDLIAENFEVGETFWRVPVRHFSPCDLNWPYEFPDIAVRPDELPEEFNEPDPCAEAGSTIECQNQVLMKQIALPGTPFDLVYRSDRVAGAGRTFEIPLTDDDPNEAIEKVVVEIELAGRFWREEYPAEPNLTHQFEWDGLDGYGRELTGQWPISVRVGYYYEVDYTEPPPEEAFARVGGERLTGGRLILPRWRSSDGLFGTLDSLNTLGMGGWALDIQHVYDGARQVFHPGAAPERSSEDVSRMIEIFETFDDADALPYDPRAQAAGTIHLEMGPEDALYILMSPVTGGNVILRRQPDGTLEHVVGKVFDDPSGVVQTGCSTIGTCGEGGPPEEAVLQSNMFDVGPSGEIYVGFSRCLWRFADGEFEGFDGEMCGENVERPADSEEFPNFRTMTVLPDGDLALADSNEIFRLDTETHRVERIAGCPNTDCEAPGLAPRPGSEVDVSPDFLTAGDDGTIYFANRSHASVAELTPNGQVRLLMPPEQNDEVRSIEFGNDGFLYAVVLNELATEVQRLAGRSWQALAGEEFLNYDPFEEILFLTEEGESLPANSTTILPFGQIAANAEGEVFLGSGAPNPDDDADNDQIPVLQRIYDALPSIGDGSGQLLAAPTGTRLYQFDPRGRIRAVVDPLDYSEDLSFSYDDNGYLVAVTDRWGNETSIDRSGRDIESITGPWGHETSFSTDADGYLQEIVFPAGNSFSATYSDEGLLTGWQDGEANASSYEYSSGRLTRAEDAAGGWKTLEKSRDGRVRLETASGRTVEYGGRPDFANGFEYTVTDARGLDWTIRERPGFATVVTRPDGTDMETVWRSDPRFGAQARYVGRTRTRTPSGLEQTRETRRTVSLSERDNLASLQTLTQTTSVGERQWTHEYDADQRTLTVTTPEGRTRVDTFDEDGLRVRSRMGNFAPLEFEYDDRGLMTQVRLEDESIDFDFADGHLRRVTTGLGTREFERDPNGQIVAQSTAVGRQTFDRNGNGAVVSIQSPEPAATFGQSFTGVHLLASQSWPDGSAHTYDYTTDRELSSTTAPSGSAVEMTHDDASRLVSVSTDEGEYTRSYDPVTGQLIASTSPDVETAIEWDGFLVTRRTHEVEGTTLEVGRRFDDNFRLTRRSAPGGNTNFSYDLDGNVTAAGPVSITYRDDAAARETVTVGDVETAISYDASGVPEQRRTTGPMSFEFTQELRREGARFVEITTNGTTHSYVYDAGGRLVEVLEEGVRQHTYDYDAWGYRSSIDGTPLTLDGNGRVTSFGARTYAWTDDGYLASTTDGGDTTEYEHDSLGRLVRVTTPSDTIEYRLDSLGRRAARLRNGAVERLFAYDDFSRPVAELDASGDVRSRFVYGTSSFVPDAMIRGGTTYRLVHDHRYSVRRVVDASTGEVVQAIDYDPLGRVIRDTNPGFQPFGFAGGLHDARLGLVKIGKRVYDTEVGRWTTPDPMSLAGSGTLLYAYGAGDPINTIDASGEGFLVIAAIVAVGGGVAFLAHQAHIQNEAGEAGLRQSRGVGNNASGPGNQIRHCVWQCMEAGFYGQSAARAMGVYHEDPSVPGSLKGGGPNNTPQNPDRLADWRANECGREQAKVDDGRSCEARCTDAYYNGEMPPSAPEHWENHPNTDKYFRQKATPVRSKTTLPARAGASG